jgi:hypothetical protein
MNRHLMRGLLALYPRAFRRRYGTELASLTDELIRAGEITPLLAALNLLGGAALEWGRVLAYSRHAAEAMAVAAIMAVAGSLYLTSHALPPNPPASARSVSAPAAIRSSAVCFIQAEPAGLVATLPWIKAEIKAAAQPGPFSWVRVVVVTVRVPGKPSTGTRPLPVVMLPHVSNALASPRPSSASQCVIVLNPPPAGWIVPPAPEWIWQPAS